jgi:Sensors of blue-light using FAD
MMDQSTNPQMSAEKFLRGDPDQDIEIDQILYCSLSPHPMDEEGLQAFTTGFASLNRMDHITGLLMYSDQVFLQMIEGPPQAVHDLWSRILRDSRHFGIVQLYHYRELERRTCEAWDMQLVSFETLQSIVHKAYEEVRQGKHSVWAKAIERMDFLLTTAHWDSFVKELKETS